MFRNIETGKKNFVTSFDERKIGIVETLVFLLHYNHHHTFHQIHQDGLQSELSYCVVVL